MGRRIWVTVKPQAKKEEIKQIRPDEYAVSVRAPTREGKANEAVIRLLSARFSIPKSFVRIIRGETARKKLIEVG